MHTITTLRGGRIRIRRRDGQRGQALIYGIFVLIGALASLFFLFNTGQLSQEKTKLVSTADAVAYSAGVMHARALNFTAYGNRALIANEVLVAQMVSLSSWAQYAQTHAENLPTQFPECNDPYGYGAAIGAAFKYGPVYALMCYGTVQYAGEYIQRIAKTVPPLASATVSAVEVNKLAIQQAHNLLHRPLYLQSIRRSVMQAVAQANYAGDGSVKVQPLGPGTAVALTDDLGGFTQSYSGKDRGRMAELAVYAAHSDRFTKERVWTAEAEVPGPDEICIARERKSEVRRRGGTELVNYDEWIAEDTESFWRAQRRGGLIPRCRLREEPIAWGEQQAHPDDLDQNDSSAWLGGSRNNRRASARASSAHWTHYTGLPSYYDLSQLQPDKDDPTLRFSVRLSRARSELRTSDGASEISGTPDSRINAYQSQVAKGEMVAVATSEVFFERPLAQRQNRYGASQGLPLELPSLFNPYWQVRLIHSQPDVLGQQMRQRGLIP
ncbi:pilus assembly protein TadG-related protein [Delftia sp. WSY_4]|uniref:pilus assembly protein TadG-related protein n=1 Tax=unclassified Delftia TaxID=2613839 RepID=UPI001AE57FB5